LASAGCGLRRSLIFSEPFTSRIDAAVGHDQYKVVGLGVWNRNSGHGFSPPELHLLSLARERTPVATVSGSARFSVAECCRSENSANATMILRGQIACGTFPGKLCGASEFERGSRIAQSAISQRPRAAFDVARGLWWMSQNQQQREFRGLALLQSRRPSHGSKRCPRFLHAARLKCLFLLAACCAIAVKTLWRPEVGQENFSEQFSLGLDLLNRLASLQYSWFSEISTTLRFSGGKTVRNHGTESFCVSFAETGRRCFPLSPPDDHAAVARNYIDEAFEENMHLICLDLEYILRDRFRSDVLIRSRDDSGSTWATVP